MGAKRARSKSLSKPAKRRKTEAPVPQYATDGRELIPPDVWFCRQVAADLWLPSREALRTATKPRRSKHPHSKKRVRDRGLTKTRYRRSSHRPPRHQYAQRRTTRASHRGPLPERIVAPLMTSWVDITNFSNIQKPTPWRTSSMLRSTVEARSLPQQLRTVGGLRTESHPSDSARTILQKKPKKKGATASRQKKAGKAKAQRKAGKRKAHRRDGKAKAQMKAGKPRAPKQPVNSMMKLKLYPTTQQRLKLEQMFAASRAIFNMLVASSREDCAQPLISDNDDAGHLMSLKDLGAKYRPISQKGTMRSYFRNKAALKRHLQVRSEVHGSAFRDFMKAIRSSRRLFFALKAKGKATSFPELKFKSKFDRSDSIELLSTSVRSLHDNKAVRFHPRFFGFRRHEGIALKESLPELEHSVRLQRLREGDYYLVVPRFRVYRQTRSTRVCAIDPGVTNFVTMYDPDGRTLSVKDAFRVLKRRFDTIASMQSQLDRLANKNCQYKINGTGSGVYVAMGGVATHEIDQGDGAIDGTGQGGDAKECCDIGGNANDGDVLVHMASDSSHQGGSANGCATLAGMPSEYGSTMSTDKYPKKSAAHRQRYRLRRTIRYTNRRVTRMVDDLHQKLASWIASNYNQVLIPIFQTRDMVRKKEKQAEEDGAPWMSQSQVAQVSAGGKGGKGRQRRITSSTARAMMAQAHYKFRMLLKYKMERAGGRLIECTEEFTSKTCSRCGEIKYDLKGSRTYNCSHCHFVHDRDVNAAKNIFHMNMHMLG